MVATIVPEEGHVKPAVHGTQLAGAPPPGEPFSVPGEHSVGEDEPAGA